MNRNLNMNDHDEFNTFPTNFTKNRSEKSILPIIAEPEKISQLSNCLNL